MKSNYLFIFKHRYFSGKHYNIEDKIEILNNAFALMLYSKVYINSPNKFQTPKQGNKFCFFVLALRNTRVRLQFPLT